MPAQEPYPIIGIVYDLDEATAVSGVTVTIKNTNNETSSITSEADGSYSLDVANLTTDYSNGDKIILTATHGSSGQEKYKQYILTIDTSGEMGEIKDIILSYIDVLDRINRLLADNWTSINTDNETPTIDKIFNQKLLDLTSKSFIGTYWVDGITSPQGLSDLFKKILETVSIDIRCTISRTRAIKLKDEVERILDANTKSITGYSIMTPRRVLDLSNRTSGLWRFVVDVDLKKLAVSRT